MDNARYRFDEFLLDCRDRQLWQGETVVELNARYLDALALMVREAGRLVPKDQFMDEVWRGVPVTDEALTQCIKTLRRQLGDSASRPRFIETVPKHGYRFIAPVTVVEGEEAEVAAPVNAPAEVPSDRWRDLVLLGGAGTAGSGVAGLTGGVLYGFAGASQPLAPGTGAISVLLVLMCVTMLVAILGGAAVSFGIAAAGRALAWRIVGGAGGGLAVGALAKLLGMDAFELLLGRSPGDITGAGEGLVLGGAVGLGAWVARRAPLAGSLRRVVAGAAAIGGLVGLAIVLAGGRLMAGSLDLLGRSMPGSRLRLDSLGALFGERGLGPVAQAVTGAMEGALFAGCIVGAMLLVERAEAERR